MRPGLSLICQMVPSLAYTDVHGPRPEGAFPLVPGSAAATEMIAAIETRSRSGALRLAPAIDTLALAASFSAQPLRRKGDHRRSLAVRVKWRPLHGRMRTDPPLGEAASEHSHFPLMGVWQRRG